MHHKSQTNSDTFNGNNDNRDCSSAPRTSLFFRHKCYADCSAVAVSLFLLAMNEYPSGPYRQGTSTPNHQYS